jgi:hypothetical protein
MAKSGCPRCKTGEGRHVSTMKEPSLTTLERWMDDGVAKATDGCKTEPDGTCSHGHRSWLLKLGLI